MELSPLPSSRGVIARTQLTLADGKKYEVITCHTLQAMEADAAIFWNALFTDYPYETVVYRLIPASTPYTAIEQQLAEIVPVNSEVRRDLELGDVYISRSNSEEAAAIEHQDVIESFRDDSIILMTQDERAAIYGPGKLIQ